MGSLTGSLSYTADTQAILDLKVQNIEATPGFVNIVIDGLTVTFDVTQEE